MATLQRTPCSEDVGAKQPNQRVRTADPPSDGDSELQIHLVRVSEAFPAAESTEHDTDGSRKSIASFLPFLEAESQQDIGRFRFLRDAQRCLIGRLSRRFIASHRLGLPWADITFRTATRGRPEVHAANANRLLDLNVSHDTDLVATASVAFTEQTPMRVGLDVMHIKNPWEGSSLDELIEGLAEQLSEEELLVLKEIEDDQARLERILALWTLKESFVKATGDGLHFDLKSLRFRVPSSAPSGPGPAPPAGKAFLHGKALEGWRFLLKKLRMDDSAEASGSYWLAVATQVPGGEGEILTGDETERHMKVSWLTLDEILRNATQVK